MPTKHQFLKTLNTLSPASVAGLDLWLDASYIGGLNNGDNITAWPDRSSAGNNPTVNVAPNYYTNVINGLPAVRFTSGDYLTTSLSADGAEQTMFVVCKISSAAVTNPIFNSSGSNGLQLYIASGKPTVAKRGAAELYQYGTAMNTTTFHYVRGAYTDSGNLAVAGFDGTVGNAATALSLTGGNTYVIGNNGGVHYFVGDICELIHFSAYLSAANITIVENYLKGKYAL